MQCWSPTGEHPRGWVLWEGGCSLVEFTLTSPTQIPFTMPLLSLLKFLELWDWEMHLTLTTCSQVCWEAWGKGIMLGLLCKLLKWKTKTPTNQPQTSRADCLWWRLSCVPCCRDTLPFSRQAFPCAGCQHVQMPCTEPPQLYRFASGGNRNIQNTPAPSTSLWDSERQGTPWHGGVTVQHPRWKGFGVWCPLNVWWDCQLSPPGFLWAPLHLRKHVLSKREKMVKFGSVGKTKSLKPFYRTLKSLS